MTTPRLLALAITASALAVVGFACCAAADGATPAAETALASESALVAPVAPATATAAPELSERPAAPVEPTKAKPAPRRPLSSRYAPWLT